MSLQMNINQVAINNNLVEQLKIKNSSFKISTFQGMEEAIEWYIENIGNKGV